MPEITERQELRASRVAMAGAILLEVFLGLFLNTNGNQAPAAGVIYVVLAASVWSAIVYLSARGYFEDVAGRAG